MSKLIFSPFDKIIKDYIDDDDFKKMISGDVLDPIANQDDKVAVLKAALRCCFGRPRGVGRMVETNKYDHITNNKNWRPFCNLILRYVESTYPTIYEELKGHSGLYQNYHSFWPDCNAELSADVLKAELAAAEQKKRKSGS